MKTAARADWYDLNDPKTGETYFRELIAKYPDDAVSVSALATLGEWQPGEKAKSPATATNTIPTEFTVFPNHPNPFNPETVIRYALPEAGHVTLRIFNILGKEVRVIEESNKSAGVHKMGWDGKDASGMTASSGVYFYQLQFAPSASLAPALVRNGKMNLLR